MCFIAFDLFEPVALANNMYTLFLLLLLLADHHHHHLSVVFISFHFQLANFKFCFPKNCFYISLVFSTKNFKQLIFIKCVDGVFFFSK